MEKILDRIRKLLELSQSDNEHEAALAAGHAARLMAEHQIEQADLESQQPESRPEPVVEEMIDKDGKVVTWKMELVEALARSFGGTFFYSSATRGNKWRQGDPARYIAVGPASVMATIRYMYSYLSKEIDRLADTCYTLEAQEFQRSSLEPPPARGWKTSFRVGCSRVVAQRLLAESRAVHVKAKEENKTGALLVINKQALAVDSFMKKHHPRLSSGRPSYAGQASSSGYAAGRQAGASVNIGGNKGLGSGNKSLKS